MRKFVAVWILLLFTTISGIAQEGTKPEKVLPAVNEVEPWQQVGQQPYELTWTQRRQDPHTLVDFEDLAGWTLDLYDGAQGELHRSRQQQMWGQYVGEILYSGSTPQSRVVARPPKPIPIPGSFDSIELWAYGNRWSWVNDNTTPPAEVSVLVTDARGKEFQIQLADVQWKQWWLVHRRIASEVLSQMTLPVRFSGIQLAKLGKQQRYFFCDSLAFYKEELNPLKFDPQPKRNLQPYRGQIVGTNTGSGTLPFPTREETILPSNIEKDFRVQAREVGPNHFEFRYEGRDATVVYEYRPARGTLGEVTARVNGGAAFRPLEGGGVRFTDTPAGQISEGELVSAVLAGNAVEVKFRHGPRLVEYRFQLWQKSLVLDVWCAGGEALELSFGRVAGIAWPKLIEVPYITYSDFNPRVLMSGPDSARVFTSVWFDWYRSNASEPYFNLEPKVTADSAEINGGMRYNPKTDGRRNNLYERVFITNSPCYEEVLPTIANPPSLRQAEGREVVWTVAEDLETFEKDHERSRRIRSYGLDKIMQHSHEITWRDEADSYTLKLHAAPQKGGDAALAWYVKAQNDMGWLQGVYTNYCDFNPVNTNWNPDHVQRTSDGEWRRAWPRTYALKPAKAVEFDNYYAQRIEEKFGVKMSYTDVHTAVAPWAYCDYDARVPGAGTFAATYYAYGQLLRNDQKVYGPTQSEGTYQWLYAGLTSGSYGWVYTNLNLLTHPPDVAFMLTKIHPLECDYGMGYTPHYLDEIDRDWRKSPRRREYIDLFLATTIAYGNMGWLVTELDSSDSFAVEAMARSYYMMQQLQQQYAFILPKAIEYADRDGKSQPPSQALATGAMADSHLHVAYENGTEVYVNRSSRGNWTVRDARGVSIELPPSGWLVFNPRNNFSEFSANLNGKRIDYVNSPEFEFLDGRSEWTEHGNLGVAGSVALRHRNKIGLELIDIYGNDRIAFQSPSAGVLTAYDAAGKSLGKVDLTSAHKGWYQFKTLSGSRSYFFAPVP